jgi:two-component system sensor histidine kinase DesK
MNTACQEVPAGTGQLPDQERTGLPRALSSPVARRWMAGALAAGLLSLAGNTHGLLQDGMPAGMQVLVLAYTVMFFAAFAVVPPLSWGRGRRQKFVLLGALLLLSLPFLLRSGTEGAWIWTFVAGAAGMQMHPRNTIMAALAVLGAAAWVLQLSNRVPLPDSLAQPGLIIALGLTMASVGAQLAAVQELKRTRHELAELAVREERSRVARDMHDILGHSLTVITVKAELAGRLLDVDVSRAAAEIADLEELARGALADVRSTVGGYRDVNVGAELASARRALAAAGIDAEVPGSADMVPARHRGLFGWVLREGVTNVVRHSGASRCVVALGEDFLQIDDDGAGPPAALHPGGGLAGLQDRAGLAGARMSAGPSGLGGFSLRVQL